MPSAEPVMTARLPLPSSAFLASAFLPFVPDARSPRPAAHSIGRRRDAQTTRLQLLWGLATRTSGVDGARWSWFKFGEGAEP